MKKTRESNNRTSTQKANIRQEADQIAEEGGGVPEKINNRVEKKGNNEKRRMAVILRGLDTRRKHERKKTGSFRGGLNCPPTSKKGKITVMGR